MRKFFTRRTLVGLCRVSGRFRRGWLGLRAAPAPEATGVWHSLNLGGRKEAVSVGQEAVSLQARDLLATGKRA